PGSRVNVQRIRGVVHHDDLPLFDREIAKAVSVAEVDFLFRIILQGGVQKHVHAYAHAVESLEGRPLFVGALQDVTETKLAQEALPRSAAFLAQGEAVSETGSFLWNLETDEIRWSSQLRRIFDVAPDASVTLETIQARVHPQDGALMAE